MPSRSESASSEDERSKKKHKQSTRSRSPAERKRHKHKHQHSSPESSDEAKTTKKHKSHRPERNQYSHRDRERSRERSHRRDRERGASSDQEVERRPIKKEKHDPGYDRHAHSAAAATSSRWEDEDDRQMRRQHRERDRNDERRRERHRDRPGGNPFRDRGGDQHQWGRPEHTQVKEEEPKEKAKPDFKLSGKLTEETNTFRGVVIKYSEPPEARKPKKRWRLYPFKGEEQLKVLHLHRQSAFLMGRERKVVEIPLDHPSCSKQHAAVQFRLVPYDRPDGTKGRRVRPYIIDLGSANGTFVNNQRIEPQRYVELMEKDVLKFGYSTREYVLLHGDTDTSELHDDDVGEDE